MKAPFILTVGLIGSLIADDQTIAPFLLDRNTDSSESGAKRANKDLVDQLHMLSILASSKGGLAPALDHISATPFSDKTQYHLFNPTPNNLLRDLSPDRPDATESPITVDAGRYQIETSLFDYRRDQGNETFTYGQINMKAGLTHNVDFQAVIDIRSETLGDWTTFGDLTIRLKYNLWGNDSGNSALAIMPFVTAPTRNDEWQGGIIVPWATDVTDDVSFGLQGQLDFVNDNIGTETEFLFTAVIGYPIIGNLGGYTEYIGTISDDRYESYYSGGFTYEINENFVLDAGIQAGLNSDSEDFGCFTGFAKLF